MYSLGFDQTDRRLQLAETTLESIRRVQPGWGEIHLALAKHLYWPYGDQERAKAELAIAQRTLHNEGRIPLWQPTVIGAKVNGNKHLRNYELVLPRKTI
jgi:hypothetical protein